MKKADIRFARVGAVVTLVIVGVAIHRVMKKYAK